jgi:hypothetical protein
VHDPDVNTGLLVLLILVAWSTMSVAVALAVGAMARARDIVGPEPRRLPVPDKGIRTAV